MSITLAIIALSISFFISYGMCGYLSSFLAKKNVLAIPNQRSNHEMPTPVGGGIAVVSAFFIGCIPLAFSYAYRLKQPVFLASALALLCLISFRDDIKHVPAGLRLMVHFISAIIGAFVVQHNGSILGGIVDRDVEYIIIVLLIVGFTNIFNFMDGIDGMSGAQSIHLGIGSAIALYILNNQSSYIYVALLLAVCAAGFLIHNWHPARIFLGDAGSVTLGYLFSILLLVVAAKGAWIAALILPMYYLADAGFIVVKRAVRFEKVWEAHSKHFFQQAVRKGVSHAEVVVKIIILNILLFILSSMSLVCIGNLNQEIVILTLAAAVTVVGINLLPVKMSILDIKARQRNKR